MSRRGCRKYGNPQRNGSLPPTPSQTPPHRECSKKMSGTGGPARIIPSMCVKRKATGCWLYKHTTEGTGCLHARWEGSARPFPSPHGPCADHPILLWDVGMCSTPGPQHSCFPPWNAAASLPPRARARPGARGRKISAWHPTKAPRGGSRTTATSRSARIWQGQASCAEAIRHRDLGGSKWSKLLEIPFRSRMEVAKAAGIPSWSGNGSQETELLHGNTRASSRQEKG